MTEAKDGMCRRERERESHRQEILKVAEEVFSAYGFEGTTIEMVARQAEFSVGSIYNFFKGKEDLFRQVFLLVSRQRVQGIREMVGPVMDRPWEALRALVDNWIDYYVKHGEFLRTAFSAITSGGTRNRPAGSPPEEFMTEMRAYYGEMSRVMGAVLGEADAREMGVDDSVVIVEGVVREFLKARSYDHCDGSPVPLPETVRDDLYGLLVRIFKK